VGCNGEIRLIKKSTSKKNPKTREQNAARFGSGDQVTKMYHLNLLLPIVEEMFDHGRIGRKGRRGAREQKVGF
jgi:hypothetical protein